MYIQWPVYWNQVVANMIPKPISTYEQSTSFPWQQSVLIFQEKNESRKEGRWNTDRNWHEEAKSLHSTRSIDRFSWLQKQFFFFFFWVTPVGCKFHLQWQKAYKEAKQQKLFSIGDPAFFLTYKRTNQALIKTLSCSCNFWISSLSNLTSLYILYIEC